MSKNQRHLMRIIIAAVLFAAALALHMTLEDRAPVWAWLIVFVAVYLIISYDVLLRAGQNIIHGKIFDENFLMIVATVGAFCVFEFVEAVAVMLFYQVGEFFQNYAVNKSRKSIAALMDICPETARVATDDGGEITLDPSEVEIGSLVVVRAGEKVPIDGVVEAGDGYLDCSALTGESAPVAVTAGDVALSGSISTGGVLRVRTQKRYEDSAVSKILELVENASAKKARAENFITRFAAWYTPAVVIAALLLAVVPPLCIAYNSGAVWTDWVTRALTFLVVSCPCALVISVPMSFFGGIGAASKHGILVKGGNYLELLDRAGVAVFDKTGTITKGKFEVVSVACADGVSREEVLLAAARAEYSSLHPVAVSIVEAAKAYGFAPSSADSATELAGRGVVVQADGETIACGNSKLMSERGVNIPDGFISGGAGTVVYVARGERLLGAIEVADGLKEDSVAAIGALKAEGVKTVMLTGDNEKTARAIAKQVQISEVISDVLPDDKARVVLELQAKGQKVAMVGDGINDAPALANADVGVAIGNGTDVAIDSADVVLMNSDLSSLAQALLLSHKTLVNIKENLFWAFFYNCLGIPVALGVLTFFGGPLLDPMIAALCMSFSSVSVVLNALRLNRIKLN